MNTHIYSVGITAVELYRPIITVDRNRIIVEAPYNMRFTIVARELGGVFSEGSWKFSKREELEVRKSVEAIYGYDGLTEPALVDVQIDFSEDLVSDYMKSIDILSRPLARITEKGRDPLIATGTVIKAGKITAENDRVKCHAGTTVVFRSVPLSLFKSMDSHQSYAAAILEPDNHELEILFYEHDQLLKRINEIQSIFELANKDIESFALIIEERELSRSSR